MQTDRLRNFIDGAWQPSEGIESLAVHNPASGQVLAVTPF